MVDGVRHHLAKQFQGCFGASAVMGLSYRRAMPSLSLTSSFGNSRSQAPKDPNPLSGKSRERT
jgi:hypothetical protein